MYVIKASSLTAEETERLRSMMSGATGLNFNIRSDLVANNTATVARFVGCMKGDPDSKATLACLRGTSFERLMNVSVTLSRQNRPPFGELFFYPSFDGDYIPERPSVMLRRGEFVKGAAPQPNPAFSP